ncbi:MAG: NAD-dependent epimerase/dehydratase family protein [Deltaproteobacteria bacterium]|nr:NAD-dependent epimerase/dehydratase family protein [Deltaproteobacteria bacterium]
MSDYSKYFANKTILVSGGAGAIGSNLCKTLASLKAKKIIILDNLCASPRWNIPSLPNVLFVEGDIRDEVKLKRVFLEEPEVIFHLAAFFANQNSIDHPESDLDVNGVGTLKLLEYARLTKAKRFIYASSGCSIYGSSTPLPLKEDFSSLSLSSPYQITKMLGELYCNFFSNHYEMETVRARFFNSYGPGEVPGQYRNVIPNFVYWALQGKDIPITGTGDETRDFTFVGDIVDGLLRCGSLEKAVGEAFNLASGREIKIADLASQVIELTRSKSKIVFAERRKWDTKKRILASVDKARELLGYEPKTNFDVGLEKTVQWFRENWDLIHKSSSFAPGMSSAVRSVIS